MWIKVVLTKVIHDLLSDITIDTTFKEMKEAAYGIVDNVEEPPEKILGTDKFPEMDVTYSEGFITIDNNSLQTGIYFAKITSNLGVTSLKLLKE